MKAIWWVLIGLGLFILISVMSVVGKYNTMVEKSETVDAGWSQVENVYQRRADLIPNLVNTVKGYASHEKETLVGVVNARAKATQTTIQAGNMTPQAMKAFQANQAGLSGALSKLMVVVEKYPDLKANQSFLDLQSQLEGTENRIAVERKRYNEAAQGYNSYIKKFPTVMLAGMMGFDKKLYFEADAGAEKAPEVQF